ncbi:MAG: alpha/beta hydrolase [Ilumatobacteraceae bacterium]
MSPVNVDGRLLRSISMVMTDGGTLDVEQNGFAWREHPGSNRGGSDGGQPIVFLHGLMGSRLSWEAQLGAFGAHRTVAWDMPGYGGSRPLETTDFAGLAMAVDRFADTIGAHGYHLVGISFGGMVAQYAAASGNPRVRSLSLISTSPCFGLDGTRPDEWRRARLASLDGGAEPADLAEHVLRAIGGAGLSDQALRGQVSAAGRVSASALRTSIDCLITHDSRALLDTIAAPTLCLVGADDRETPSSYSQYLADHIPAARLVTVAGAGHLLNAEAPGPVNDELRSHIEAHA